jgi:hypothetical protein
METATALQRARREGFHRKPVPPSSSVNLQGTTPNPDTVMGDEADEEHRPSPHEERSKSRRTGKARAPTPGPSHLSERSQVRAGNWDDINRRKRKEFAKSRTVLYAQREEPSEDDERSGSGAINRRESDSDQDQDPDGDKEIRFTKDMMKQMMTGIVEGVLGQKSPVKYHGSKKSPSKGSKALKSKDEKEVDEGWHRKGFCVSDDDQPNPSN